MIIPQQAKLFPNNSIFGYNIIWFQGPETSPYFWTKAEPDQVKTDVLVTFYYFTLILHRPMAVSSFESQLWQHFFKKEKHKKLKSFIYINVKTNVMKIGPFADIMVEQMISFP